MDKIDHIKYRAAEIAKLTCQLSICFDEELKEEIIHNIKCHQAVIEEIKNPYTVERIKEKFGVDLTQFEA
jgi:hypothetical protein